ncbi:MAG: phosphate ABC transporter substrate-binding protein [Deferrisomatales bacterium]|nr:phosphate ABC transporter substrate-binding protein [Deferrisomatales bacterium]
MRVFIKGLSITGLALCLAAPSLALEVDSKIQPYSKVSGVSGSIKSVGSDTLNNLMTLWSEGYRASYPAVRIEIEGKGSSTAPPALIQGTSHFGPMSRAMKGKESDEFEKKFGYKPSRVRVAVDALAVFVNKDNPLQCLSMKQLDAIFSKNRKGGYPDDIHTWGELGLTGEWANKPISLYGRNSASGTYGFFKEEALFKGDYKDSVKEQPGSSAVVQGVASDKYGIGYSGVGYKTADVRTVPLSGEGGSCYDANAENAYSGDYPLARFLFVYLNKNPNTGLDPLRGEFIKYVFSKEGQIAVIKDGYFPVSKALADQDLAGIGLK